MIYRDGQLLIPISSTIECLRFQHLPKDFETILFESENGPGPFGSKVTGQELVAGGRGNWQCRF